MILESWVKKLPAKMIKRALLQANKQTKEKRPE